MFCQNCGALNASNARFCSICGHPLSEPNQEHLHKNPMTVQGSSEPSGEIRRFLSPETAVSSVAFSPDGHRILSAGLGITIWDAETGNQLSRFGSESVLPPIAFSSDGHLAVSSSRDQTLRLWDLEAAAEIRRFKGVSPKKGDRIRADCAAFSPDGRLLVSGSGEFPALRLWDVQSGQELNHAWWKYWFSVHPTLVVSSVGFSSDGHLVVSNGSTLTSGDDIRIWDLESGREAHRFVWAKDHRESEAISGIVFSPDGQLLLLGCPEDKTVRVWHIESGREIQCFRGHSDSISTLAPRDRGIFGNISVAFSSDGRQALSGGDDGVVILWNTKTGAEVCHFRGHSEPVTDVAFSLDGRLAVSGSEDRTVRLWRLPIGA